ncbi:hypothetical protein L1887_16674 [Cichorium endivia]|nr:hypothetical protein L1887_16674 [Cichorium endivia]
MLSFLSAVTLLHPVLFLPIKRALCRQQPSRRRLRPPASVLASAITSIADAAVPDVAILECLSFSSIARGRGKTIPEGTMGYLAPGYIYSGVSTVQTDVYSFGVLLQEVALGRRPVDENGVSFGVLVQEVALGRRPVDENGVMVTDWVWDLWKD